MKIKEEIESTQSLIIVAFLVTIITLGSVVFVELDKLNELETKVTYITNLLIQEVHKNYMAETKDTKPRKKKNVDAKGLTKNTFHRRLKNPLGIDYFTPGTLPIEYQEMINDNMANKIARRKRGSHSRALGYGLNKMINAESSSLFGWGKKDYEKDDNAKENLRDIYYGNIPVTTSWGYQDGPNPDIENDPILPKNPYTFEQAPLILSSAMYSPYSYNDENGEGQMTSHANLAIPLMDAFQKISDDDKKLFLTTLSNLGIDVNTDEGLTTLGDLLKESIRDTSNAPETVQDFIRYLGSFSEGDNRFKEYRDKYMQYEYDPNYVVQEDPYEDENATEVPTATKDTKDNANNNGISANSEANNILQTGDLLSSPLSKGNVPISNYRNTLSDAEAIAIADRLADATLRNMRY